MTDRINGFWVALEKDVRIDDAEPILNAAKCIKGVIAVKPNVSDHEAWMAYERARRELGHELWRILYPETEKLR